MFNIINTKNIYRKLASDTKDICKIIINNGFKDNLLKEKDWNVFLIYYHLLSIIYVKIKFKKGSQKAEKIAKKLVYESAIRLPEDYPLDVIINTSSNIITKFVSTYRCSINSKDISFTESLANSICKAIEKDNLYFMKKGYDELINELKKYIEDRMFEYDALIK